MYAVSVYFKKKLPSIRQGPGRVRPFTSLLFKNTLNIVLPVQNLGGLELEPS